MQTAPAARLHTSPASLAAILGPLRAEILAVLWRLGRATARDVHRQLHEPHQQTYDTVCQAMRRLAADGYLARLPRKKGSAYVYVPGVTQEEVTTRLLHQILDGLAADYPNAVAAYIARHDQARRPRLRLVWARNR